jgi:hypothetical protein
MATIWTIGHRAYVEASAAGEPAAGPRTALLCLEQDPSACHRRVICEALADRRDHLEVVDLQRSDL